jgi:hypothetical protein
METGMALDAALRNELIKARERIIAQLDELNYRVTASGYVHRGEAEPPDYRTVFAELEQQLREIHEILETDKRGDA